MTSYLLCAVQYNVMFTALRQLYSSRDNIHVHLELCHVFVLWHSDLDKIIRIIKKHMTSIKINEGQKIKPRSNNVKKYLKSKIKK